ncbi:PREDICTED: zinc finger RNA-binding protein-like [Crocodylus porosus]|uniref:zinc finger RNA-binding protein-like n=1 Tax=Crocodylus porosus TaxID=8502 RepID=UPI000940039A|nr:PREDICTED: zinc finger RNA-binding protein-like [Crocodylus porosus]
METESELKKEKFSQHPFYCSICKISCASALHLQTHFLGSKHRTVEEALKAHGIVATVSGSGDQAKAPVKLPDYVQTEPEEFQGQTLGEHLNACKDSEPALGLDYITEYRSKDNFHVLYECQLCDCQTGLNNMFMHIYGAKHRMAYLRQHYPEIVKSDEVRGRGSELNRKLKQVAATIEMKEGRKQIKVVTDPPIMKRKWQEHNHSKAKIQHVDVSTSSEGKADGNTEDKQTDSTQSLSSQGGKDTQDKLEKSQIKVSKADKLEAKETVESRKDDNTEGNSKDSKAECDDSRQSRGENQDVEDKQQEANDVNSEGFTSQDELLEFLQCFEILNEEDASFILKVTQILTDALVEYRQQVAPRKENSSSVMERNEPQHSSAGFLGTFYENDVTAEFLNSVRNMDVEELTTTLHKIAATNPAFRGIDIPNVIRILTESGNQSTGLLEHSEQWQ